MEENKQMQIGDESFNILMQEVGDIFRKYNPPVHVAFTGIFFIVSEVAQRQGVPKEALQSALGEVYDNVTAMLEKENNLKETPPTNLQ
jgi:hypothetical protein